jgi:hypothetical protein
MRTMKIAAAMMLALFVAGCAGQMWPRDHGFTPVAVKRVQHATYRDPKSPDVRGRTAAAPGSVSPIAPSPPSAGPPPAPSPQADAPPAKQPNPFAIVDAKAKRKQCEARAKAMKFGIHWIKRNRFVKACIAGAV